MSPRPGTAGSGVSASASSYGGLDDQEESVRIAVRALGDMRNGTGAVVPPIVSGGSPMTSFQPTPALSTTSRSSSPSLPSPSLGGEDDHAHHSHHHSSQTSAPHSSSPYHHISPYPRGYSTHGRLKRGRDDHSLEREYDREHEMVEGDEVTGRHPPSAVSPATNGDFVSRVSHFPLVNSALRVYEHSKASSRVVKYGAEMMESSVKSISKPVIDRLPVNQLDEFACRQLDRLGSYGRRPVSLESRPGTASSTGRTRGRSSTTTSTASDGTPGTSITSASSSSYSGSRSRTRDSGGLHGERERYEHDGYDRGWTSALRETRGRRRSVAEDGQGRRSRSPEGVSASANRDVDMGGQSQSRTPTPRQEQQSTAQAETQVVQRSRWQAVLLEAGGIGAAVSEESMRRLKYCLQWLQYATEHIDAQILILRDFILSLQQHAEHHSHPHSYHHHHSSSGSSGSGTSSSPSSPPYSPTHTHHPFHNAHPYHPYNQTSHHSHAQHQEATDHLHKLTAIRRDVVDTIRQVVDVVSKYAGGALPEPARARVRSFILCLPQRWAAVATANINLDAPVNVPTDGNTVNPTAGQGQKVDGKGKVKSERASRGGRTAASVPYSFGEGSGRKSRPASRATSPSATRNGIPSGEAANGSRGVVHMAHAAQKILTLATESLDMLRAVTQVFKESLDKADAWVERLRVVGVQRPSSGQLDLPPPGLLPTSNQAPTSPLSSVSRSPIPPFASPRLPHAYDRPHSSTSSMHLQEPLQNQVHVYDYREPLPPIILTPHPGSPVISNAPSPSPIQTQLPPLQAMTAGSRPGSKVSSPFVGSVQLPGVGAMFGEMSLVGSQGQTQQGLGLVVGGIKRREEDDGDRERDAKRREIDSSEDGPLANVKMETDEQTEMVKMEVDG